MALVFTCHEPSVSHAVINSLLVSTVVNYTYHNFGESRPLWAIQYPPCRRCFAAPGAFRSCKTAQSKCVGRSDWSTHHTTSVLLLPRRRQRVRVAVHISTYNRRHRNCRRQAPSRRHGCGALVPLMQRTLGSDMALNGSAAANGVEVICSTVHGGDHPLLPAKIFRERPLRFGSGEKLNQKSLAAPLFTMSRKEVDGWEGKSCSFVTKRRTTQYDMHTNHQQLLLVLKFYFCSQLVPISVLSAKIFKNHGSCIASLYVSDKGEAAFLLRL